MEITIYDDLATITVDQLGYREFDRLAAIARVKNPLPPLSAGERETLSAGRFFADLGRTTYKVPFCDDLEAIMQAWADEERGMRARIKDLAAESREMALTSGGRYVVLSGSESKHCCFSATVVDTESDNSTVCECFDGDEADRIAAALNAFEGSDQ